MNAVMCLTLGGCMCMHTYEPVFFLYIIICTCVYTHLCVCVRERACVCVCVCVNLSVQKCIGMNAKMRVTLDGCKRKYTHEPVFYCIYVHLCVYVYACV